MKKTLLNLAVSVVLIGAGVGAAIAIFPKVATCYTTDSGARGCDVHVFGHHYTIGSKME